MRMLTDNAAAQKGSVGQPITMVSPQLGNLTSCPPEMKAAVTITTHGGLSKEVGMARGGVAHDAAAIVASMCAMKSNEEVLALFDMVYNHILARVTE